MDEKEIQRYITQKLSPFGDAYEFGDLDEQAIQEWIGENLP